MIKFNSRFLHSSHFDRLMMIIKIVFIFLAIPCLAFNKFEPKCIVNDEYQLGLAPIPWHDVNLDLDPVDRFVSAYSPFSKQIQAMINELRGTVESFGKIPSKIMETFLGQALESLFPNEYKQEINGISQATNVTIEDLALLNSFYELSRFCTSILAKDNKGNLLHARNLDFGQLFGGWNAEIHEWRLTSSLKKLSVNLNFKRNGTTIFKGTTFAGHVGLLSGFRPNSFSITINARLKPNFHNLIKWLAHMLKPNPKLVLWTIREVLDSQTRFEEAFNYLSYVHQIADAYYILGGVKSDQAVIIVRNQTNVVQVKTLDKNEWFLLQTNYDPGKPSFFLDDRQKPGERCMKKLSPRTISLNALLQVLSSKPTLNKTTVHSIVMSLSKNEYYSFTQQNCTDPCWFV